MKTVISYSTKKGTTKGQFCVFFKVVIHDKTFL